MRATWSEVNKRTLWRHIWIALAEAQARFGLVTPEQVADLKAHGLSFFGIEPVFPERLDVFDFKLSDAEMTELKKLNATNMRVVNPPHAPMWDAA